MSAEEKATNLEDILKEEDKSVKVKFSSHLKEDHSTFSNSELIRPLRSEE